MVIQSFGSHKMEMPTRFDDASSSQLPKVVCSFCKVTQSATEYFIDCNNVKFQVWQRINCGEPTIDFQKFERWSGKGAIRVEQQRLYPLHKGRKVLQFPNTNPEIVQAYNESCKLYDFHAGASGAFARRALELILDQIGYSEPSLARSIEKLSSESDPDKKLPQRFRSRLDYIKEIGNFALHIRRDDELSIVLIDADEVEACLSTIEELMSFLFEEPALDLQRVEALNKKLEASGKRKIKLGD